MRFYQQLAPELPIAHAARVPRRHRRRRRPASSCCSRTWRPPSRATSSRGCSPGGRRGRGRRARQAARAAVGRPVARPSSSGSTATRTRSEQFLLDAAARRCGTGSASGTPTDLGADVHEAGDALFARPRRVPRRRHRHRGRSSTATTGSTTSCSIPTPGGVAGHRRRLADLHARPGPAGRRLLHRRRAARRTTAEPSRTELVRSYHAGLVAAGVAGLRLGARAGATTAAARGPG